LGLFLCVIFIWNSYFVCQMHTKISLCAFFYKICLCVCQPSLFLFFFFSICTAVTEC
jgi:hypothetical protein